MFDWSDEKDELLRKERGISFLDIIFHIERGDLLVIADHPNPEKYPHQMIMYVKVDDYVYMVPFIETGNIKYLKTVIPSRKAKKKYLEDNQ